MHMMPWIEATFNKENISYQSVRKNGKRCLVVVVSSYTVCIREENGGILLNAPIAENMPHVFASEALECYNQLSLQSQFFTFYAFEKSIWIKSFLPAAVTETKIGETVLFLLQRLSTILPEIEQTLKMLFEDE